MSIELDHLGRALRALRQAANLTQTAIHNRTGISGGQISKWEHGHETPSLPRLARFLNAVGADFRALQDAIKAAAPRPEPPQGAKIRPLETFRDREYRRIELVPELREIVGELIRPTVEGMEELRRRLDEMEQRRDGDDED
ncbi:MAG: helix-turn-helix transcriptional regulator [bacterium]|nr:helix-turn-helix transcriptional regulator [bacterium]